MRGESVGAGVALRFGVLYRILRRLNAGYALAVLGVYVLAFLVACGFMFIFPQITLLLFFLGLGGLGIAVLLSRALQAGQRAVARRVLAQGRCPRCRQPAQPRPIAGQSWRCASCGVEFDAAGQESPEPSPLAVAHDRL